MPLTKRPHGAWNKRNREGREKNKGIGRGWMRGYKPEPDKSTAVQDVAAMYKVRKLVAVISHRRYKHVARQRLPVETSVAVRKPFQRRRSGRIR